jgi:serine/threonine protein phosphatase 1
MATYAIGDIHGNLDALEDLLDTLLPVIRSEDTLVFMGDYIDRGPNSKGCLDQIIRLEAEAPFRVVALIGNHEDWMLRTLRDYTSHSWVLGMEAFETIASYSAQAAEALRVELENAGMRLITEKVEIPYEIFFDLLPSHHIEFLQNLVIYHRTPDALCVHGGLDPLVGPMEQQESESIIWGTDRFPAEYRGDEVIVYGHWGDAVMDPQGWPRPNRRDKSIGIDTIGTGVLTALKLPEYAVYQSRMFPSD